MHPRRTAALVTCFALFVGLAPAARSAPEGVDAKRAEARRIQERLEAQGRRLSIADEEYNQAALERQRLEGKVESARDDLATAEARWAELKERLGKRVRALYKHPGSVLSTYLDSGSISELSRSQALADSVMQNDTALLHATERARKEVSTKAEDLGELHAVAKEKESQLASKREDVAAQVQAQRGLLQEVRGDVRELIEADREAELASATREAERQAAEASDEPSETPEPGSPEVGETLEDAVPRPAPTPRAAPRTTPEPSTGGSGPAVHPGASKAVSTAAAQIGKPYRWGAGGPDAYDCSGLTSYAWRAAGVSLPHSSRAQYASLPKVSKSAIRPGDLLFFGSPIHHVGIYEGGGVMIEAPYTGENVRRRSIHRSDYAGAARPG